QLLGRPLRVIHADLRLVRLRRAVVRVVVHLQHDARIRRQLERPAVGQLQRTRAGRPAAERGRAGVGGREAGVAETGVAGTGIVVVELLRFAGGVDEGDDVVDRAAVAGVDVDGGDVLV